MNFNVPFVILYSENYWRETLLVESFWEFSTNKVRIIMDR